MLPALSKLSSVATDPIPLAAHDNTEQCTTVDTLENWKGKWGWKNWISKPRFWLVRLGGTRPEQAVFTEWSLTHMLIGALQFILIPPAWQRPTGLEWWRYLINLGLHALFEVFENSPWGLSVSHWLGFKHYDGDSVANSVGDLLSFSAGYLVLAAVWDISTLAVYVTLSVIGIVGIVPFVYFLHT